LVDDVEVGIGFDEAAWGGADSGAHVCDQEASIWLSADLIGDGCEQGTVAL
jgi:hypothetical protein